MIVVMKQQASVREISQVLSHALAGGLRPHVGRSRERTVIGVTGGGKTSSQLFSGLAGVEEVRPVSTPYILASRSYCQDSSRVEVRGAVFGGRKIAIMAGPCAVESRQQLWDTAGLLLELGVPILRGGAYKPRSSPYSFQGLKEKGLEMLCEIREKTGLGVVSEVITPEDVPVVAAAVDILQVGARNMQNFALLEAVGRSEKPVLLKRGLMATLEELLMAAEYILAAGNPRVILCERGIRTFEKYTRNTLDIAAVPAIKQLSHLPVAVDPSHSTGLRDLVLPAAKAAVAAGADALIVEVHPRPDQAMSDGPQSLDFPLFRDFMQDVRNLTAACGREV